MKSQRVSFKNASGDSLSGQLDLPFVGTPKAYVLFAHCFTCSKNLKAVDNICQAMVSNNMGVFRFDFTGLGQSEGDFSDSNFSMNISDLHQAYSYLEEHYEAPQILMGHSLGGAAVLHAAGKLPKVRAVVTIGAPSTPLHVKHLFKNGEEELLEKGEAEVNIGGRPFKIRKQFIDDLEENDSTDIIRKLGKAGKGLLIMHSPQDEIVGITNAAEIYDHAMHPKSFITLDGSDHLMTDEEHSSYVGLIVCPWASRYIDAKSNEIAPEGEVWAQLTNDHEFSTEITAGEHLLVADEPKGSGGKDLGPSPYGYLLTALGSCTAMTLHMYARFKKLKLDTVKVKLTHDKIHSEDGGHVEETKGKIDQIKRKILLEGDLTDAERKRLIEIADKCPVHKTLEGKPQILTEEVDE